MEGPILGVLMWIAFGIWHCASILKGILKHLENAKTKKWLTEKEAAWLSEEETHG